MARSKKQKSSSSRRSASCRAKTSPKGERNSFHEGLERIGGRGDVLTQRSIESLLREHPDLADIRVEYIARAIEKAMVDAESEAQEIRSSLGFDFERDPPSLEKWKSYLARLAQIRESSPMAVGSARYKKARKLQERVMLALDTEDSIQRLRVLLDQFDWKPEICEVAFEALRLGQFGGDQWRKRRAAERSFERGREGGNYPKHEALQNVAIWTAEANRIWGRKPSLSKAAVARLVAERCGGNPNTIRRRIRKP